MAVRPEIDNLLPWPKVRPLVGGIARVTWWRAIRRGEAPKAVQVAPGRVAWRESEIREWQDRLSAQRSAA